MNFNRRTLPLKEGIHFLLLIVSLYLAQTSGAGGDHLSGLLVFDRYGASIFGAALVAALNVLTLVAPRFLGHAVLS